MISEETYHEMYSLISQLKGKRILAHKPVEGLTHAEARVTMFISRFEQHFEEVRPSVLAQVSKMTPSALSQIIKSLTKKGLVERRHRSEDYRAVYIMLTPKGQEYAKEIEASHLEHIRALADYLGEDDLTDLIRILKKVNDYREQIICDVEDADRGDSLLDHSHAFLFHGGQRDA